MYRIARIIITTTLVLNGGFPLSYAGEAEASPPHSTEVVSTPRRNVVLIVTDGLRAASVNAVDTPTLFGLREEGVWFKNSHSIYPTLTTPNAAAIASGKHPAHTADYSNTEYIGRPVFASGVAGKALGSPVPFIENDIVLADLNQGYAEHGFFQSDTLLSLARAAGYQTAAVGKLGPTALQDIALVQGDATGLHTAETPASTPHPSGTLILDDATGSPSGIPLSAIWAARFDGANLEKHPPARKQPAGDAHTPGTTDANVTQQAWFMESIERVILPQFKQDGRPFALVYWSRDPDGTQHNQGDSLNRLTPGINGPTSKAALKNADNNVRSVVDAIRSDPELAKNTDIFITSDHGFATISRHEISTQGEVVKDYSSQFTYTDAQGQEDTPAHFLPSGFLAIDIAHALELPLYDPDTLVPGDPTTYRRVDPTGKIADALSHPSAGNGLIGGNGTLKEARIIVAANGGTDLIYLTPNDPATARRLVAYLLSEPYTGGIFADPALGKLPGTLSLEEIGLNGQTSFPKPSLVVSFKSFPAQANDPLLSAAQLSDTGLQEGQGMHGALTRENTWNYMLALGPDFKPNWIDPVPAGNADILPTLAKLAGFPLEGPGDGRVLTEALINGPKTRMHRKRSHQSIDPKLGRGTVLHFQEVDGVRYLDATEMISLRPAKH